MKNLLFLTLLVLIMIPIQPKAQTEKPLRVAVAGITHNHVGWILGRKNKNDIELVGIFETNKELSARYVKEFGFKTGILYTDLEKMLDAVKPEAVLAFGSIYEHMAVVEACAPRKIHVMVEKPLAVSLKHAERMASLSKKYGIQILTNYETSWYPTTEKTLQLVDDSSAIGKIKKAV
ncbi:MAG: Gfo/Idh/MocA family protein, partial [Flavisolibacter sp.]